jgi:hypothetical protein
MAVSDNRIRQLISNNRILNLSKLHKGEAQSVAAEDYPQARYKKWDADSSSQRIIE